MNWTEFSRWSRETLGIAFGSGNSAYGKAVWGPNGVNGVGTGFSANYGIVQQRRLAVWQRVTGLVAQPAEWVDAGETHDDGWLINDGQGIRWIADSEIEWNDLLIRGFIAIKCGVA